MYKRKKSHAKQLSGDDIIIETAWLYYHDNLTQEKIAQLLHVSRPTVANYLQKARDKGFVRTSVSPEVFLGHRLSHAIRAKYNLQAVYIIPDGKGNPHIQAERVAKAAAEWIPTLLKPHDTLGVAWGETMLHVANYIRPQSMESLNIVQLVGSMPSPYGYGSEACATIMAKALGAHCINLYCPAVVSTIGLAEKLCQEPIVARQLNRINECNKAVFAAGGCEDDSHIITSSVTTPEAMQEYREQGAVGVLCAQLIDADGRHIPSDLQNRTIAVDWDFVKSLEMGILVSSGSDRVKPMIATLNGGFVTHMITNTSTAEKLLQHKR